MSFAIVRLLLSSAATAALSMATISVTLTPDLPSPQPLGTSIHWTATVTDSSPGEHRYRFLTQPTGFDQQIRRDFSPDNTWTWTPSGYEDTVRIIAIVVNGNNNTYAFATSDYTLTSRLISGHAAVNATGNPLVALFSAPPCLMPNLMRVRFHKVGETKSSTTNMTACRVNGSSGSPDLRSMNFYVAGMYPNTTYLMNFETVNPGGSIVTSGTEYAFTTGAIPASAHFPPLTVTAPPPPGDDDQPILLWTAAGSTYNAVATDLLGNPLWYYGVQGASPDRTSFGGNMMVRDGTTLREIDVAGNALYETNVNRVSTQLVAAGYPAIQNFNHDARRIFAPGHPVDGYIMVIAGTSILTEQFQGGTPGNPVEIVGDEVVVLDRNLQLAWAWNPFAHLDLSRPAVLGETCAPTGATCRPFYLSIANDWTHANSIQYTAYDSNLIMSLRHQDWVIKINFADATGNGDILWRMGPGGDFTITTAGTGNTSDIGFPWFSHQHDAEFELFGKLFGGRRVMTVMDNGNTRIETFDPEGHTRCQSYAVDETNRTVNLNISADTGVYSSSRGSAQLLTNGDLSCDAAAIQGPTGATSQTSENDKMGNLLYIIQSPLPTYRTFRMHDLYTPITP